MTGQLTPTRPRLAISALVSLLLGLAGPPVGVVAFILSLAFQVGVTLGGFRLWVLLRLVGITIGLALGIAGLLVGLRSRQLVRESAGRLTGRGLALAGAVLSAVTTVVMFVFLVGIAVGSS